MTEKESLEELTELTEELHDLKIQCEKVRFELEREIQDHNRPHRINELLEEREALRNEQNLRVDRINELLENREEYQIGPPPLPSKQNKPVIDRQNANLVRPPPALPSKQNKPSIDRQNANLVRPPPALPSKQNKPSLDRRNANLVMEELQNTQ